MKYIRNGAIYSKRIGGSLYLLESNKKFMRELNDVAMFIWEAIEKPVDFEKLQTMVCKEYDVTKEKAGRDIDKFLHEYVKDGYISSVS